MVVIEVMIIIIAAVVVVIEVLVAAVVVIVVVAVAALVVVLVVVVILLCSWCSLYAAVKAAYTEDVNIMFTKNDSEKIDNKFCKPSANKHGVTNICLCIQTH
jgi:hypothetical protein